MVLVGDRQEEGTNDRIHRPLTRPPRGKLWHYNHHSKEWRLVDKKLLPPQHENLQKASVMMENLENGHDEPSDELLIMAVTKKPIVMIDPAHFYQHAQHPNDTFQGICLRYGITPTQLRQHNKFSGTNLFLAPEVLIIPVKKDYIVDRPMDELVLEVNTRERKMRAVLRSTSNGYWGTKAISAVEAKAYLEIHDWDVEKAIENANEDLQFEAEEEER
jgi:hypothetical protein